jgi:hypothetical protein
MSFKSNDSQQLTFNDAIYTCLSNFVTYLHKQREDEKLEGFEHYYDPNDYNRYLSPAKQ